MNPITVQDILEAGKHASLTGSVLGEWAEKGTPKQREYLHGGRTRIPAGITPPAPVEIRAAAGHEEPDGI
ncbi:hypothetical protein [Arthrobacter sp. A5]|uniref:hypothetical protein n=1 Tax=Arthrobacter sp. A5 TaxID=576926 RepID=UPI003DA7C27D